MALDSLIFHQTNVFSNLNHVSKLNPVDSESIWKSILSLKESMKEDASIIPRYLNETKEGWMFENIKKESTIFAIQDQDFQPFALWKDDRLTFSESQNNGTIGFLKLYLPHCFAPLKAKSLKRALCTVHIAQTIDGKIATQNGSSKWIGNEENLKHAHRMRALHEGVVVGKNTYLTDHPQLTVRHVNGENPKRFVIWGASESEVGDGFTALTCLQRGEKSNSIPISGANGNMPPEQILRKLYLEGVHNIYLEGGAYSVSEFLNAGMIDQLQIHISNKILGSGISGFQLAPKESISESIMLNNSSYFPVGNEMMIVNDI